MNDKNKNLDHDIAIMTGMDGEDAASNYGRIGTAEQKAKLAGLEIDPVTGEKKKKDKILEQLLRLQEAQKKIDDLFDNIDEMYDQYKSSVERSNKLKKSLKENDIDAMRLMAKNEYGQDIDQMSDEQVRQFAKDKYEEEIKTQADLEKAILKAVENAQSEIDALPEDAQDLKEQFQQKLNDKLASIKSMADTKENLDYEGAQVVVRKQVGIDNALLSDNQHGDYLVVESDLASTSFAATIDEDPFAEVESITSSFNAAASDAGLAANDLTVNQNKSDVENKTELASANKPVVFGLN